MESAWGLELGYQGLISNVTKHWKTGMEGMVKGYRMQSVHKVGSKTMSSFLLPRIGFHVYGILTTEWQQVKVQEKKQD